MVKVGADLTGQTMFEVKQGGSFTIPKTVSSPSPTSTYLAQSLDAVRDAVGGELLVGFTDAASGQPGGALFIGYEVKPGDVVSVSAVSGGAVNIQVNSVTIATLSGVTTVAGVIGFFG